MRQEPEIFTTTTFFFFLKRTIRITTNMVGPHNLFFVFLFEDLFYLFIYFFPGYHPVASSRFVRWFWLVIRSGFRRRSSRFAAVCKHKNTTRVASVRQSFRLFRAPPFLSRALTTSPSESDRAPVKCPVTSSCWRRCFFTWRGWCSWRRCFLSAALRKEKQTAVR